MIELPSNVTPHLDGVKHGNTVHGHAVGSTVSREYQTWRAMKARCFCATNHVFKYYGGRGITVCERWLDFGNFLADMGPRPRGFTIDRIDNNGNYEPKNCRWASQLDQMAHTRKNKRITLNGETHHLSEWCRRLGIKLFTYYGRIYRGWTTERALTKPARCAKIETLVQGTLF